VNGQQQYLGVHAIRIFPVGYLYNSGHALSVRSKVEQHLLVVFALLTHGMIVVAR